MQRRCGHRWIDRSMRMMNPATAVVILVLTRTLLPITVYRIAMNGPVEMTVAEVYAGFARKEKAVTKAASASPQQTTASPAVGSTHVVTTAAVVPAASVQAIQLVTCSRAIGFEVERATRQSMPQTTTAAVAHPMRAVSG